MPHPLTINPEADKFTFKPAFIERYSELTDFETFATYCKAYLRKSIRVNTLKTTIAEVIKRMGKTWQFKPIPWCKEGFWIQHEGGRRDIGNTFEHILGYVYVQEAASMLPPVVLGPKPGETVLDLCAAPGSKTSQIAAMMQNSGVLVANDITGDRIAALGVNLMRCGVANTVVTQMKGERLSVTQFDKILVDAPCSGTGTIRKSLGTLQTWNPDTVRRISSLQRKILHNAYGLLKPGGTLVYSTCSLEPDEDEAVVNWLLEKEVTASLLPIELPIERSKTVMSWDKTEFKEEIKNCLRIWPQDNDTEGFFVAKVRKAEN